MSFTLNIHQIHNMLYYEEIHQVEKEESKLYVNNNILFSSTYIYTSPFRSWRKRKPVHRCNQ